MIPPKPSGSLIEERVTPDGCTLRWRLPSSGIKSYLPFVLPLFFVVVVFAQGGFQFPRGGNLWMWVSLLPLVVIVFVPLLGMAIRRPLPESVTLGADSFRHNLGRPGGVWASVDSHRNFGFDSRPLGRRIMGLPLEVELPKAELGDVVIERVGGQLRLRYDVGAERVEIGRYLREPEKEWLARVIHEWQTAAGAIDPAEAGRPGDPRTAGERWGR